MGQSEVQWVISKFSLIIVRKRQHEVSLKTKNASRGAQLVPLGIPAIGLYNFQSYLMYACIY